MRIGVLAHINNWHSQEIRRAAAHRHTFVACHYEDLAAIVGQRPESHFRSNGCSIDHLDALVVRPMPKGSLEQVIFRMDLLLQLANQHGTRIVNHPKTIEASVDKYLSLEILRQASIQVPTTFVSQTASIAVEHFECLGGQSVIKPIFGSGGKGIQRISSRVEAERLFRECETEGRVIYQQQFIDHGDFDFRLLVIGEKVIGMKRELPGHWVTNVQQGATVVRHDVTPFEFELAVSAARALGADIAGVDLLYDQNDRPYVVEVNACPSWRAISDVVDVDIAAEVISLLESPLEIPS